MRRFAFLAAFAALACLSLHSSAESPGRLQQITEGVWFRLGDAADGQSNNAVIEIEDGLLVVDANLPNGAEQLLDEVAKVSSKPVTRVFNTHHHGDHLYGNPVFTKSGARTFAFRQVVEEMQRDEPALWKESILRRYDVNLLGLPQPEPPRETWDDSPHVIEDGLRRVEFHRLGWGHTRGDGWVYLPAEKILITSDAAVNCACNNPSDANLAEWPAVVGRALELDVKTVLPGHGPAGGREILDRQRAFLEHVGEAGRKAVADGKPLSSLVASYPGAPPFAHLPLPNSLRDFGGPSYAEMLRAAFEEARSGKPYGQYFDETKP
jgi:glyoxylase-like metal-dependent hydrolase (beta-lactamase superfamily II)